MQVPKEIWSIGSVVEDRYRIDARIGSGGMSTVYRARHLQMDCDIAIKVMSDALAIDAAGVERFRQEAKAEAALKHPNILAVRAMGATGKRLYLVMDYLEGESLSAIVKRGALTPATARKIFIQIADGLSYAHDHGVVHRDLKPANIMVSNGLNDPLVKIVDFGIAKWMDAERQNQQRLTATGSIIGTPAYMSPEQCMGEAIDARADIYSFGCLMFETLTGRDPFVGDSQFEILTQQIHAPAPSFADVDPNTQLSPDLEAIVQRAMEKEPDDRFQSCAELCAALELADLHKPYLVRERAATNSLKSEARMSGKVIGAIAASLLVFAGATVFLHRDAIEAFWNRSVWLPWLEQRAQKICAGSTPGSGACSEAYLALADQYFKLRLTGAGAAQYQRALDGLASAPESARRRAPEILARGYGHDPTELCKQAMNLSQQFIAAGDFSDAEAVLRFTSYGLDAPRWSIVGARNALSSLLLKEHKLRDAQRVSLDALSAAEPGSGAAHDFALGDIFVRLGDESAAEDDFAKAIDYYKQAVRWLPETTAELVKVKQQAEQRLSDLIRTHGATPGAN